MNEKEIIKKFKEKLYYTKDNKCHSADIDDIKYCEFLKFTILSAIDTGGVCDFFNERLKDFIRCEECIRIIGEE